MSRVIHVNIDKILEGWNHSCAYKDLDGDVINECSVGKIASWGAHYICIIHEEVPNDDRKAIAEFIANAPEIIKKLTEQTKREGKLILKMKDDISFYKRKVNNLSQKLKKLKTEKDES